MTIVVTNVIVTLAATGWAAVLHGSEPEAFKVN